MAYVLVLSRTWVASSQVRSVRFHAEVIRRSGDVTELEWSVLGYGVFDTTPTSSNCDDLYYPPYAY